MKYLTSCAMHSVQCTRYRLHDEDVVRWSSEMYEFDGAQDEEDIDDNSWCSRFAKTTVGKIYFFILFLLNLKSILFDSEWRLWHCFCRLTIFFFFFFAAAANYFVAVRVSFFHFFFFFDVSQRT